ncbi:hypothetical protein JTB14_026021 [Gonioctena quinquepunctata]|nr:hypothetical protein JTB14_026021 [Gonioctena quinquepunctata]
MFRPLLEDPTGGETESPEQEATLLKYGSDEENFESSKALTIGKNRNGLSGAARKRFEYLIKQGLPAEEARVKSVELMKKESTSDKGLRRVRSENKTHEGKHAPTKPHFCSSHNRPGWVALMCADNTAMQWLKSTFEDIKPWEGAELRIVEEAEMPHNENLMAYLPGSQGYSTEKILGFIEAQTATNSRVLRRASGGPLELLTLSVDHQSAERLTD